MVMEAFRDGRTRPNIRVKRAVAARCGPMAIRIAFSGSSSLLIFWVAVWMCSRPRRPRPRMRCFDGLGESLLLEVTLVINYDVPSSREHLDSTLCLFRLSCAVGLHC